MTPPRCRAMMSSCTACSMQLCRRDTAEISPRYTPRYAPRYAPRRSHVTSRNLAEIFAEISLRAESESSQVIHHDYNHDVLPIQGLLYMLCYKAAVLSAAEVAGERAYIAQRLQARHAVHVKNLFPLLLGAVWR